MIPEKFNTPLAVAIEAAKAMDAGKTLDEAYDIVNKQVQTNPEILNDDRPTSLEIPEEKQTSKEELYYRYYMAYLRLATGQINGLNLEALEDVACVATVPAEPIKVWCKKKGLRFE